MTDAVEKRYEEAVERMVNMGVNDEADDDRVFSRKVLDAIGFRALLEIEDATRDMMDTYNQGQGATYAQLARVRAALTANAVSAARATEGEKT